MTIDHDKRAARQQRIANAVRERMTTQSFERAIQIDGGGADAIAVIDCGDLAIAVQSDVVWDALAQVRQVIVLERNVASCANGDARAATISALIGSMSDRDRAELLRALIKDHAAKSATRYQVEVAIAALEVIDPERIAEMIDEHDRSHTEAAITRDPGLRSCETAVLAAAIVVALR